jgi:hypothetical protein
MRDAWQNRQKATWLDGVESSGCGCFNCFEDLFVEFGFGMKDVVVVVNA